MVYEVFVNPFSSCLGVVYFWWADFKTLCQRSYGLIGNFLYEEAVRGSTSHPQLMMLRLVMNTDNVAVTLAKRPRLQ